MDSSLGSLLNLYRFSTGRRIFAMKQVKRLADERSFRELSAHATVAIDHDRTTRLLDAQWAGRQASASTGETQSVNSIDGLVDRALTALRDGAQSNAAVAVPGDGMAQRIAAFLLDLFPAGVAAVTTLPFVEELAAVDVIVEKLHGPLAPNVEELGLTRHATRLKQLVDEYRAAIEAPKLSALDFGKVRAARAKGQDLLLQSVAIILGRHYSTSPQDAAARAALLGPILAQNESIRLYLRARRPVDDVDPETGDVDPRAPRTGPEEEGGESTPD